MPQALTLRSDGDVELEAEHADPDGALRAGAVLCHPHPQYGGNMRSIVIGALFEALPAVGVQTLRFNFRGVERSTGTYDDGRGEREDARAAIHYLSGTLPPGVPLILAGWSFGADVAMSLRDPEIAAWIAIAPPMRYVDEPVALGSDPRMKLIVLAEHDEVRPPAEIAATVTEWQATEVEIVPGASHFFVGRTDRLTGLVTGFVDRATRHRRLQ